MINSYWMLAVKEIRAQKLTAILILAAVMLSTIMTTAIGQSMGILETMRIKQASQLNGDRYATFHQLTEQQRLSLFSDERLTQVGSRITVGHMALANSGLTLYLREYQDNALKAYESDSQVKEGRLPAAPYEIALPEDALQYLPDGIGVGDEITLDLQISKSNDTEPPFAYVKTFRISGILESNYYGYATGIVTAVIGEGTAASCLPNRYFLYSAHFKTIRLEKFQPIVDELAQKLVVSEQMVQYNWVLLDALGVSYDEAGTSETETGFSFMLFSGVLVGVLVLSAAGLVIYNILKIAVTRRISQYGTLRAIGCERRQLYRLVTMQLLILCGIGIPIGLLIGVWCSKGILIAATGILNPDLFLADSTGELNAAIRSTGISNSSFLAFSVLITLFFAVIAAFPAARYAAHASPTVAMAGQAATIKRRRRIALPIRNFEAYYAKLNLKRSRGRTAVTIMSLIMSITVFVALQNFTDMLDTSQVLEKMQVGDYAVTNETVGIDSKAAAQLGEYEDVERLAATKLSIYEQDAEKKLPVSLDFQLQTWETFQIAGVDDARLCADRDNLSEKDILDLRSGKACIVKNPIPFSFDGETVEGTNFDIDDVITVNGIELRVAGIADMPVCINNEGFINGVQIIVNEAQYDTLTGKSRYAELYPVLRKDASVAQFEAWLDRFCDENTGTHWLSYLEVDKQRKESFEQINLLCMLLILFIGMIGILNIINTVYSSIHTRIGEIGIQRAIGMSKASLYKTFLWEGVYYAIIATIIGGVLGYICTIFINAATENTLELSRVPVHSIIQAAVVSISACLLATAVPLRVIARMNIIESIDGVR